MTAEAIPPGATIGILGGGQLGRMTALAAARLGYRSHGFDAGADTPLAQVAAAYTQASFEDADALARFGDAVDVVTLEWENVPPAAVDAIARTGTPVRPGSQVLAVTQDRRAEKAAARQAGLATAPYEAVTHRGELDAAVAAVGCPCRLKTATLGYDGKGQARIDSSDGASLDTAWQIVVGDSTQERGCVVEGQVAFVAEISVIVGRRPDGAVAAFPAVENRHERGILRETLAPASLAPYGLDSDAVARRAEAAARSLTDALGVAGLLAVEFFVARDGSVLVNELAPRPHNSGHWSFDAAWTSQFEQHVRTVCNLPLGPTAALRRARMVNLLGEESGDWPTYLADPRAKLHLYGKAAARPGRKMGHVVYLDDA